MQLNLLHLIRFPYISGFYSILSCCKELNSIYFKLILLSTVFYHFCDHLWVLQTCICFYRFFSNIEQNLPELGQIERYGIYRYLEV